MLVFVSLFFGFFSSSLCFFMFNGFFFFLMEVIWKSVKREAKHSHCVPFLNICQVLEPGGTML